MPKDSKFLFENKTIQNLYSRHDQMLEGAGNVVVLQRKLSPASCAIMEDVQSLLENPAARPHIERKLKDMLSDVAIGLIGNSQKR